MRGVFPALFAATCLMIGPHAHAQDIGSEGESGFGNADDYPIPSTARESYSAIREGFTTPIDPRQGLRGAQA